MANRSCSVCGKQQSAFGPGVLILEYEGKDYCPEHMTEVKGSATSRNIPVEEATTEQKLTGIVKYLDAISRQSIEQTRQLKSINSIMIVFVILIVIGILFQGCSALGSIR